MAGNSSRDLLIKKAGTNFIGVNNKSMSINDEPVDTTTDDDNGYRTVLAESGQKAIDISFGGVAKDNALRALVLSGGSQLYDDITVNFPPTTGQSTGDVISGSFYLTNLNYTGGAPNGAIEFDGSFQSSGEWIFTAGTPSP